MTKPGYEHLPGLALEPGTVKIPASENVDLAAVLECEPPADGALHPLFAYIAPQRGIGTSIAELCELGGSSVDAGPMMGSTSIEFGEPMLPDVEYTVTGEILDLEHKHGRSIGDFDLLTFREVVRDPDGRVVSSVTNTFVLRGGDG